MAEFKIDGRMTVRQLKENFKNEFEGTLRVYDGKEKADDNATLAAIRKSDDVKVGEYVCRASRTVGKFVQEMLEDFGIKVQVASPDDWVLALDGITLANLKNIKKNATKADMEELVAYKRGKHSKAVAAEREEEERTEEETLDTLCEKADEIKELVVSEFSKRLEELSTIAEEKGITTFGFTGGYIEYPYEDEFDSEEEYEEANETYETFFDSKMNFIWVNDNNFKLYDGLSFVISNGYVNFTSVIELDGWDNEEYFEDEDSEWMFDPNLYDNWTKCSKIIRAIEIELGIE